MVGLQDGRHRAGLGVVDRDVENCPGFSSDVGFIADDAERLGGCRQNVEHGVVGLAAGARRAEGLFQGHFAEARFHRFDGQLHRQQFADLVFGQMQHGHWYTPRATEKEPRTK